MECLNEKYNLDYYSSSVSDSDFELEHKNDQYIWMLQLPPGGSSVKGPPKLFWPINLKTV